MCEPKEEMSDTDNDTENNMWIYPKQLKIGSFARPLNCVS